MECGENMSLFYPHLTRTQHSCLVLLPLLGFVFGDPELGLGGLGAPSLVPVPSAIPGVLPTSRLPGFLAGGLKRERDLCNDRGNRHHYEKKLE